jgi:hypothetical protein
MSNVSSARAEIVRLELDLGSYELETSECRELIRFLERRGERPDGAPARAAARRLEDLVDMRAGIPFGDVGEEELDALADAAWDWLQRDGPDRCPERVLLVLDVVRARHAHE